MEREIKQFFKDLPAEKLQEVGKLSAIFNFCHRMWYELYEIENISEETRKVVAQLLWDNIFNDVINPMRQLFYLYEKYSAAAVEDKWQYVSEHDTELLKEYFEFEEKRADSTEAYKLAKRLFNKIIREEYFL